MRYTFYESPLKIGYLCCEDKETGLHLEYKNGSFNDDQRYNTDAYIGDKTPSGIAKACREMADWIHTNHKETIFAKPSVYSFDEEENIILRAKFPEVEILLPQGVDIDNEADRKKVASALKKCAEWLVKGYVK